MNGDSEVYSVKIPKIFLIKLMKERGKKELFLATEMNSLQPNTYKDDEFQPR